VTGAMACGYRRKQYWPASPGDFRYSGVRAVFLSYSLRPLMPAIPLPTRSSNKAAALIIALAFVVLLTGVALAYLSRTTSERQQGQSSYNNTSAGLLARS